MNEDQPVTQQQLREALKSTEEHLLEAMRDMQTEILRGFERYARGQFARFHTVETQTDAANRSISAMGERITALEERVLALETRPPRP